MTGEPARSTCPPSMHVFPPLCSPGSGLDACSLSLPASSQNSAPPISPPIVPAGVLRHVKLVPLGCDQASPFNPAVLDLDCVNVVDDGSCRISTFVCPPPQPLCQLEPITLPDFFGGYRVRRLLRPDDFRFAGTGPPLPLADAFTRYNNTQIAVLPAHPSPDSTQRVFSPPRRSPTSILDASLSAMNTITSAPGSPPELSGSRSSKSSSYCSSSQPSSPDGIASDITNFEEIGLENHKHGAAVVLPARPVNRVTLPSRTPNYPTNSRPGANRPNLPALKSQVQEVVRQQEHHRNSIPQPSPVRRGFTSPIPGLPPPQGENVRPRSTSPPRRTQASVSTTALSAGSLGPNWNITRASLPLPSRRGSWQPQRKSVQELEAEYHDSDDELPEDTSLWNVPVSPHPANRSARSSFHGSPVRTPLPQSPRPIPLEHARTAPDTPPRHAPFSRSLPKQRPLPPRSSSLSTSLSNPSSPCSHTFMRNARANSWNLAMADLSEEARIVSQHLELYAETTDNLETQRSYPETNGDLKSASLNGSKANTIQLPPVQKSNLDFMPISKEKEAILSRTRPSWLPPKDPREERKHLKEYQRMMAASIEAEKKRKDKIQSQQSIQDNTRETLNRIWQYYCAESTDLANMDVRVFDLCWRGISPKLRGKVWQRSIGNQLGLTVKSYEKALNRAREIRAQPPGHLNNLEKRMDRWFTDIERDAETAFPQLNLFQRNGPLRQDLVHVCEAYTCYRSDIGYVYGIQLMGALLLLQVPTPAEAFILLANCLNKPTPLAFQSGDLQATRRIYNHALSTLAIKFPRLHEYLFGSLEQGGLGFTGDEILEPMLRTMFTNGLDIDRLCRVWDIWAFEGDKTLVRTAVALLGSLQAQIFEINGDVDLKRRNVQEMLGWGPFNRITQAGHWHLDNSGDEEKFVGEIRLAGTLDYRGK